MTFNARDIGIQFQARDKGTGITLSTDPMVLTIFGRGKLVTNVDLGLQNIGFWISAFSSDVFGEVTEISNEHSIGYSTVKSLSQIILFRGVPVDGVVMCALSDYMAAKVANELREFQKKLSEEG
jgi:hypothetical protein